MRQFLSIQSCELPSRMPHRNDKGLLGPKLTCNMEVCRWLQRTRWERARKQVNWSPTTVYQKSCYCIYTVKHWNWASLVKPIFVLGQGPTLTIDSRQGFVLPSQKSMLQVEKPKCAHWEFPTAEAPAQPMKSVPFFTSPLAKGCPGCFIFSLDSITQG